MRIKNVKEEQEEQVDITQILTKLQETHKTIYMQQIDGQLFLYRPLGRKEYKNLAQEEEIDDMEKEEIVCHACVLWPEDYDFEDCPAGIPTSLFQIILKNSFLDSIESRKKILQYFRYEMFDMDNQISCIINEAFPMYDMEEIENWDVAKTAKFLAQAEWKLINLRGLQMNFDPLSEPSSEGEQPKKENRVVTEEIKDDEQHEYVKGETIEQREQRLNLKGSQKKKLTPQELEELKKKYPEMQWGDNALNEMTEKDLVDSVDTTSHALRLGY